jgi:hypothetical protein
MSETILSRYRKALKKYGSQRKAAEILGIPRSTIQGLLKRESENEFKARSPKASIRIKTSNRTKRFIFTAAQNNTLVHEDFFSNLEAYAVYLGAQLHVATFTYDKKLFEDHRKDEDLSYYSERLRKYITNQQFDIGDNLVFCGNMNTLPTAVTPLTGFETYTRGKWGIFPHAKVQLSSVPTMPHQQAKQIMTTGACTLPNYIQKRAGIRAHFHHMLGAVLVEVDKDGDHFCRHLLAEEDTGNFQDLTNYVSNGKITTDCRVEAVTWGDIHREHLDPIVAKTQFGIDIDGGSKLISSSSVLDVLMPAYQFIHDSADFYRRNHHTAKDVFHKFETWVTGKDSVDQELQDVMSFLNVIYREWCETVVVESNHDLAFTRWAKDSDFRDDPPNAELLLEVQLAMLKAIRNGESFSGLKWFWDNKAPKFSKRIVFLDQDDTFTICNGEIECAMHGHLGINGSKPNPKQFTKAGPKANTAHTHSPGIIDGIYTAGTSSKLRLKYNAGLSSWANAFTITYPNAKRAIVTLQNGKWRG